jgi:hypothetical protein
MWSIIKRKISKKYHKIKTTEEMGIIVQKEYELLTKADYLKCVDSMKKWVRLCIKAKGGLIKY